MGGSARASCRARAGRSATTCLPSRPFRVDRLGTDPRAISSAGRAPPRQGGGHWFEPSIAHRRKAPHLRGFSLCRGRTVEGIRRLFSHILPTNRPVPLSAYFGGRGGLEVWREFCSALPPS